jgi:hypothetical protein
VKILQFHHYGVLYILMTFLSCWNENFYEIIYEIHSLYPDSGITKTSNYTCCWKIICF